MDRRSSRRWSGQVWPASQRPARRNPSRERSRTTHHRAHRARAKRRLGRADAGRVEQSVRHPPHPPPAVRPPTPPQPPPPRRTAGSSSSPRGRDLERLEDDPLQLSRWSTPAATSASREGARQLGRLRTLTGRPSASASTTTPRWTAPTSVVSSFSRGIRGEGGSKRATSSSCHSRRRPPASVIDRFDAFAATPIDQRSCSRASPPARVRRIRSTAHGPAARGTG